MSDEARRGRLILLALSVLLVILPLIDAIRAVMSGDFEDSGPFLGLILWGVLLYKTYRGSTIAKRFTLALLLLGVCISVLVAFWEPEQGGPVISLDSSPDPWELTLGALALASAIMLVASRPIRSFLEFQRAGKVD